MREAAKRPMSETMASSRRGLSAMMALGAACALSLSACKPPESAAMETTQKVKPAAVETMTLKPRSFTKTLEYPGVAEPLEQRMIAAESSGRVLDAPFKEGAPIKRGELMLRTDAKMNSAQINVLESQARAARRERDRLKQLAAEGLATPQQLDQATSNVEQLDLSIKQAKVGVSMSTVRSPVGGYVLKKMIEPGEFIGAGQPIAEVIDYETIVVKLHIPESAINYASEGQQVELHFPSIDYKVQGLIKRRGVQASQPTQTFPVEIHIENKDMKLLPGMRATVTLPKSKVDNAIVVPRDAILEGVNQREAMVARDIKGDEGTAQLRVVEFGEAKANEVVITKGLEAGEHLIVLGHRGIVDGTPVLIVRKREEK